MSETDTISALAASLNAGLDEDEAVALACISITDRARMRNGVTPPRWVGAEDSSDIRSEDGILRVRHTWMRESEHITRHDPVRVLREVAGTRNLIAAIVAEPHLYLEGDSWYSCSKAVRPDPDDDEDRMPGSGCMDDTRRGKPCDCGRDARVERLLTILAGIYAGPGGTDDRAR